MPYGGYWWFTESDGEICLVKPPRTPTSVVIATGYRVREHHSFHRRVTDEEVAEIAQIRDELMDESELSVDEAAVSAAGIMALITFKEFLDDEARQVLDDEYK